jgi:hypothetical protein
MNRTARREFWICAHRWRDFAEYQRYGRLHATIYATLFASKSAKRC